ncbi:MAG: ABC transporter ATP-binding protein [Anaerolineaceae bacterium]|jgi:oligopeptide/dipeptide ABC transporter ATP-binding protein
MKEELLLQVKNLTVEFISQDDRVVAVDDVSFDVFKGETLCIVGESGCGKSATALSIMRLIPDPPGKIIEGEILLDGLDLRTFSDAEMREIRGKEISMIFQEPMTSLNPVFKIGTQIAEAYLNHNNFEKKILNQKVLSSLQEVKIMDAEIRSRQYPHEMSGGMRQRVMISMALANKPRLLIADEPTTALDVTIQAQILDLMKELKNSHEASIVLITHDLGVVADVADRVIVMYAGQIIEEAGVYELFREPMHPYTEGLLNSIPKLEEDKETLYVIEGSVPPMNERILGCKFRSRCPYQNDVCKSESPSLMKISERRKVACFRANDLKLLGVDEK